MKPFSKSEIVSLIVIFSILIAVSIPNFIISVRRARDQTRRDDMGSLVYAFNEHLSDFETFPQASSDGRIVDCLKPGDKPVKDILGGRIINLIPCDWGKDSFINFESGKVYMSILPRDPDYQKGAKYLYFTDGERYQIYAAMEGLDEAEVDPNITASGLMCGSRVCNIARSYKVPVDTSIEEYDKLLVSPDVKK